VKIQPFLCDVQPIYISIDSECDQVIEGTGHKAKRMMLQCNNGTSSILSCTYNLAAHKSNSNTAGINCQTNMLYTLTKLSTKQKKQVSTAYFNKISNISVGFLCCWCIAHNIKECYTTIIPVYQSS
jgi:hypothetical protein